MKDDEPVPRPNLFTARDADAWDAQFHFLFYVLKMPVERIAQIDFGLESDHPLAEFASIWGDQIAREFPYFDALAAIRAAGRRGTRG